MENNDNDPEDIGFFGLIDAVIEHRKNNPEPEYISPVQAERTRIIGIIETEIERLSEYKSNRGRILALENIITKITHHGK